VTEELLCRECGKNKAHPLSATQRCDACLTKRKRKMRYKKPVCKADAHPCEMKCPICKGMGTLVDVGSVYLTCKTCKGRGSLSHDFSIELRVDLNVSDLWPAGEAPIDKEITVADVAEILNKLDTRSIGILLSRSQGHVIRNCDGSRTDWD